MTDIYEVRKLLIRNGFTVDFTSQYPVPVVVNSEYETVRSFLLEQGYDGDFIIVKEKTRKK